MLVSTDSGSLLVCGQNHKGQLGLGHTTDVLTFASLSISSPIQQVSCGWDFSLFLTSKDKPLISTQQYGHSHELISLLMH